MQNARTAIRQGFDLLEEPKDIQIYQQLVNMCDYKTKYSKMKNIF